MTYRMSVRRLSRDVQDVCTPRVLWLDQPTPSHHILVACEVSVRHGYVHTHGVQKFCTPPLHSCGVQKNIYAPDDNFCSEGVQKNVYAPDNNFSYKLFPSSELLIIIYNFAILSDVNFDLGCVHHSYAEVGRNT
jgi:hypothetical protein